MSEGWVAMQCAEDRVVVVFAVDGGTTAAVMDGLRAGARSVGRA